MRMYRSFPIFETTINGIPCHCIVLHYLPEIPPILTGPMEDADPGAGEEFDFMLLDDRYIRAPWIAKQVTDQDEQRLLDEYLCTTLEFKYYINERE